MIPALIEAAQLARLHTTAKSSRQLVELLITEDGLVCRGAYKDARDTYIVETDVTWRHVSQRPGLALLAVLAVVGGLERRAVALGKDPVKKGSLI